MIYLSVGVNVTHIYMAHFVLEEVSPSLTVNAFKNSVGTSVNAFGNLNAPNGNKDGYILSVVAIRRKLKLNQNSRSHMQHL